MASRAISILDGALVVAELRRQRRTQKDLAARSGLREATVSNAVSGQPMRADTIIRLVVALSESPK
jgi:plasmid maintenance system antidote protein VapI